MLKKLFGPKDDQADLSPQQLAQRRTAGEDVAVIDVRQPDEYRAGHVPGSTLIPLDQLSSRLAEVPKNRPVVVMCHSGNRSRVALSMLQRAGYANVTNLQGGMSAWQRQQLPVERGT